MLYKIGSYLNRPIDPPDDENIYLYREIDTGGSY